jgi:hypothetical protein
MTGFFLTVISLLVSVIVVPAILLAMLLLGYHIAFLPSPNPDQRVSSIMAFWLGIAIFGVIVILNIWGGFFVPATPLSAFDRYWLWVPLGTLSAFILIGAVDSFLQTRARAILVVLLSASSLVSLYFYAFVERLRDPIVLLAGGVLLGALLYTVLFPRIVRELLTGSPLTPFVRAFRAIIYGRP